MGERGDPKADDWRKSLALCLLCSLIHILHLLNIQVGALSFSLYWEARWQVVFALGYWGSTCQNHTKREYLYERGQEGVAIVKVLADRGMGVEPTNFISH